MYRTRSTPIFFSSLLLIIFIVLSASEFFVVHLPDPENKFLADNIFYYSINIGMWISAAFFINTFLASFLWGSLIKPSSDGIVRHVLIDFTAVFIYCLAWIVILTIVFNEPISTFWILFFIAVMIIGTFLRKKVLSFFSGTFITTESPFSMGDWIEIHSENSVLGEVVDISKKTIKLKTESGTVISIPTQLLSRLILTNHTATKKEIKHSLPFLLDYSIESRRAKRVLLAGLTEAMNDMNLTQKKSPSVMINNISELGIEYLVQFWFVPWKERNPNEVKDLVYSFILKHLSHSGLTLAYPKHEVFFNEIPLRQSDLKSLLDKINILSKNDLFSNFNNDEIEQLSKQLELSLFNKGDILIREGEKGDSMFILVEGLVDVVLTEDREKPIELGRLAPNNFFGEMSLLTGEKRSATVIANTDTLVYEIKKSHLIEILQSRESIVEELGKTISKRKEENIKTLENEQEVKINLYDEIVNKIKVFFSL